MPFALQLYFDPITEGAIRDLWWRFAEAGIASYLHESPNRPHITLIGYDALDLARAERSLTAVARACSPFSLTFSHLGAFLHPSPVVFLAPTPTVDLLRLHRATYESSAAAGTDPWEAYLPGQWVPHCTIVFHMDATALPKGDRGESGCSTPPGRHCDAVGRRRSEPDHTPFLRQAERTGRSMLSVEHRGHLSHPRWTWGPSPCLPQFWEYPPP